MARQKTDKKMFTFYVKKELLDRISELAQSEERTKSWFVNKAIEKFLEEHYGKDKD